MNSVSWEFPWLESGADVDHESAKVTRQAALVSLPSLATSIATLGPDNGLTRFATKVSRPRRLIRPLVAITGALGVGSGSSSP